MCLLTQSNGSSHHTRLGSPSSYRNSWSCTREKWLLFLPSINHKVPVDHPINTRHYFERTCHLPPTASPTAEEEKQRQLAVPGRALQGGYTLWGEDNPGAGPQVLQVQKLNFNSSPRGDQTLGDWFTLTKLMRDWFINQNTNLLIYNEKYNCQTDWNTCVSWSAHSLASRKA